MLYPPTKPSTNQEIPIWLENGDSDDENVQKYPLLIKISLLKIRLGII
jgi:hypothetical protein